MLRIIKGEEGKAMMLGLKVRMGDEKTRVIIDEFGKPILCFTKDEALLVGGELIRIAKELEK